MNVLIVCHHGLYQDLSASFVHQQACALAGLGHSVRAIVPIPLGKHGPDRQRFTPARSQCKQDGVTLEYVRFLSLSTWGKKGFNTKSGIFALRCRMKRILKDFEPDVIHAHTLGFDSDIGKWLKKKLGCPLIVTSHGSDASVPYEQGDFPYLRRCCDGVDAVVAVSSALAGKIKSCGTNTPVFTILNGFVVENLSEGHEKVPFSILQAGALSRQKRQHVTIQAFAKLKQRYPLATLTLVGSGAARAELEQLCCELGIGSAVRFTGQIPNPEVLKEMAKTSIFVMPSVREGFGIVYLEAMASGCVTIGTQGEGIADVLVHSENGFLVPPDHPEEEIANAISWCFDNPAQATELARQGKRVAEGLTWKVNAEAYVKLFEELIHSA